MTTAPTTRPIAPTPIAANAHPQTAQFIDALFGTQTGQLCLGYIAGDPLIEDMCSEWYDWPRQRPLILQRFAEHDAQDHDTYVRQVLFTKRRGTKANALPSPWIWQDDVKETRTAYTLLVETSAGNHQAFVRLDRPATTTERERLMTYWRDRHADADACSADPVHFVRVPGGHNHKRHGRYLVQLVDQTGRVYPADRLLDRCGGNTPTQTERSQHGHWRDLPDGAALLRSPRWQKIATARPQLRQLLVERQRVVITNKNGRRDDSLSAQRAVLIQNLITARPYGRLEHLPEREIRAAALALQTAFGDGKTDADYQADIDRLIDDYRPKNYTPVATHTIGGQGIPARRQPKVKRGRAGDHAALVEQVYSLLVEHKAGAEAMITATEVATAIGCHRRTIVTILGELRDAGRIATRRLPRHGGLVVSFLDVIYSPSAEAVSPQPSAPNPDPPAAPLGETEIPGGCVSPKSREADHSSLVLLAWHPPLALPPPTLAELAAHYLDQRPAEIGQRYVQKGSEPLFDVATGEIKVTRPVRVLYRRTARHFAALVVAEYPYTTDQAIAAYVAERQRRKDLAALEWRRFFIRLRAMSDDELISYIGGRCKTEARELASDGSTFDKHLYSVRLRCARQQLRWRGVAMPSRKTQVAQAAHEDAQRYARRKVPIVACQPIRYAAPAPVEGTPTSLLASLWARKERTQPHADHGSENVARSSA